MKERLFTISQFNLDISYNINSYKKSKTKRNSGNLKQKLQKSLNLYHIKNQNFKYLKKIRKIKNDLNLLEKKRKFLLIQIIISNNKKQFLIKLVNHGKNIFKKKNANKNKINYVF